MNKKVIFALALAGVGLYLYSKKEGSNATTGLPQVSPRGQVVAFDPYGGHWVVYDGKKYGIVSEAAFAKYGWMQPQIKPQAEIEAIPDGGWVAEDGLIYNNNGIAIV